MNTSNDIQLYKELMDLVENNEAFYYKDYEVEGILYRVFNYRLASYTDFQKPSALEARGITFLINPEPLVVSRPYKKFFNLDENPFTMGLDLTTCDSVSVKLDGSLITTYYNPYTKKFGVKSKQDFFSDQSTMAWSYLTRPENLIFTNYIYEIASNNYSVIMELISPANRIVIEYPKTELKIHGIRHNSTGELIYKETDIFEKFGYNTDILMSMVYRSSSISEDFIKEIPCMTGTEGFVFTKGNDLIKLKTSWYKSLHHLKDSVNSERRLFESIIDETVDDVKTMFTTDKFMMDAILEMESRVIPKYNHIISSVETFYLENKDLTRKEYALKAQSDQSVCAWFSLAMEKYIGRPVNYKEYCKKYRKELFEIKDDIDQTNPDRD
jgi:T4 RnlA family RNA ligase